MMRSSPERWRAPGLLKMGMVTLLAALPLAGCKQSAPPAAALPEIATAVVISKPITDWDEYTGRFQAVDSVEVGRAPPATSMK